MAYPIEFIVQGTPVSLQSSSRGRESWKSRVRSASEKALPTDHDRATERIAVTLFYFPDGVMQGDIDNIVKPILDAMNNKVYDDDNQVDRVVVQRFVGDAAIVIDNPSAVMTRALVSKRPLMYVRISDKPLEQATV
jgi:hypothetical protein